MSVSFNDKLISFRKKLNKNFKYFNLLRGNLDYPQSKFVIYTRGRTGSTVLSDLLNCHPEIFCDVEIFNFLYSKSKVQFPYLYISSCSKRASAYKRTVYGFRVKKAQLKYEHKYKYYREIFPRLHKEGWKFIHLKRLNFLKHTISNLILAETKVAHIRNGETLPIKKIKVDCNTLLENIKYSEEVERAEENNLNGIPNLKIIYENDILDNTKHQNTANKVFSFLGLKPHKVNTQYKRIVSENLQDVILNYDEVYEFFKDTEYLKYLN